MAMHLWKELQSQTFGFPIRAIHCCVREIVLGLLIIKLCVHAFLPMTNAHVHTN